MSTTISHEQFVLDGNYLTAVMKLERIAAALSANTVLGKKTNDGEVTVTTNAASAPAGANEGGANTGTGTLALDGTNPTLAGVEAGVYLVKCKSAATAEPAAEAVFEVFSPDGGLMGQINAGTDGADVWSNRIKFTITDKAAGDGEVAFVAGDAFAVTVTIESTQAAASNELAAWDPTATDGSEVPYAILAANAPASEDEQYVSVYIAGTFNADGIIVPEGSDAEDVFDALREKGIYLIHQADDGRNPAFVTE